MRILVVDDNAINRMVVETMLGAAGYEIDCVDSGQGAIEAVRDRPCDLVLMDVAMPEMDGMEATRRIRALGGAAATVPIVALTAFDTDEDVRDHRAAGMNDHLAKPIDSKALLATIARWIGEAAPCPLPANPMERATDDTDAPLIDNDRLDRLRTQLPPGAFRKILNAYADGTGHRISEIEAAMVAGDLPAVARHAHDLRGTTGTFGAMRLQESAKILEAACKAGHAGVTALVESIRRTWDATWTILQMQTGPTPGTATAAGQSKLEGYHG